MFITTGFITARHLRWPLATALLGASCAALASHEHTVEHVEYARVIHVEPLVQQVDISIPVRECWQEPVHHVETRNDYTTGRTVLGGIIGAVIGHQVGSGRGNDAATVAGGLAGAAIGANSAAKDTVRESHVDYEDRCRTTYKHHQEERVEGYEVTYRFGGRDYTTVTQEHPGKRIPVNVHVSPVMHQARSR